MRAVFAENDPVDIATKLLNDGSDSTKAKIFVQCLEYLYGKPVQQIEARGAVNDKAPFSFITHIPRPKFPGQAPDTTDSTGTTEEDDHV